MEDAMGDRPFDEREDEDDPWVLTLVVETRKGFPVSEAEVYEAAARAVASARDAHHDLFQPYEEAGHIRKLVRHAAPARFRAVSGIPQCLVVAASGLARVALVAPSPRSVVPAVVAKLQLTASDERFERDRDERSGPAVAPVVVAISPAQPMTVLKTAAQVAHAAQLMHAHLSWRGDDALLDAWRAVDFATSVAFPGLAEWGLYARAPVVVRDAGFTEVPAGAHTVSALPRAP
jgi:peptidyl-tRNA hydrolase